MEFIKSLIGTTYSYNEYLAFLIFTILGMLFIKLLRYNSKKKAWLRTSNTPLKFSRKLWLDDNLLDFILAFMTSFFTLRFLGDLLKGFAPQLPQFTDVMLYGLLLGVAYQYVFHKLMNKVTIKKTVENIKR